MALNRGSAGPCAGPGPAGAPLSWQPGAHQRQRRSRPQRPRAHGGLVRDRGRLRKVARTPGASPDGVGLAVVGATGGGRHGPAATRVVGRRRSRRCAWLPAAGRLAARLQPARGAPPVVVAAVPWANPHHAALHIRLGCHDRLCQELAPLCTQGWPVASVGRRGRRRAAFLLRRNPRARRRNLARTGRVDVQAEAAGGPGCVRDQVGVEVFPAPQL
mmetsp:Transcript_2916/g.9882  ORF Transcript_2916/g.9882 Transcript_2916/m.9882 type:complete len:216 (+) Transcript_2916:109-756(+)